SVLVMGLGGVGLSAILGAKAAGARKIIGADIKLDKRHAALKMGANLVVNPLESDAINQVLELTHGGVDVALEFAGAMAALDFAFKAIKRGGTTVTAALPHPDERFELSPVELVAQEKTLKGSYLGSCVPERDIPNYLELYSAGRLNVGNLISHRIHLDNINEGFERLANGEAIRQIVIFD